jgi:hypothetical protein
MRGAKTPRRCPAGHGQQLNEAGQALPRENKGYGRYRKSDSGVRNLTAICIEEAFLAAPSIVYAVENVVSLRPKPGVVGESDAEGPAGCPRSVVDGRGVLKDVLKVRR